MGNLLSRLKTLYFGLEYLLDLNKTLNHVLTRASAPPGLPVPNPTPSYWLEDPPFPDLVHLQSPTLPSRADIVIIGSGITGAAVARSILQECLRKGQTRQIVVLEARTLCSGATGRNRGHMKASPQELFADMRGRHGEERAAATTRFQLVHVGVLTRLCRQEGWEAVERREVTTADLFLDDEGREKRMEEVEELRRWVPELRMDVLGAEEAREKFGVNDYVQGAISYPTGALWPYRLVSSAWNDLLTKFLKSISLEMVTPVLSIYPSSTEGYAYEVVTTRGTIHCDHVVHATNAFASHVLGHMTAQHPGTRFPNFDGRLSWSVIYEKAYDYVTQRPMTTYGMPGDIMLGGGFNRGRDQGLDHIGRWDDSQPRWGDDREGWRVKKAWVGCIAFTGDGMPFVGRLDPELTGWRPGRKSTGNGVEPGDEREDLPDAPGRLPGKVVDWFPAELKPSLERVKRADLSNLVKYAP
ncbi:FAD dependent oxidoreductase-domain-containing protein [Pseudomassariella vexata]|uniref:FAD dependent oxidoreductase-domain-containing protein n=1 Tax=Pseudomassariella vexata TaxID=1141098 RepID=A0A1Y2DAF4_9PEZI|nr:FAD dependent oxidoreductase-domain-containing protein [Pseudomassariella vexata]ORY56086.1 FAD dependent oxidoreductase-domain-containing protein [Pseudomassariella vexata]